MCTSFICLQQVFIKIYLLKVCPILFFKNYLPWIFLQPGPRWVWLPVLLRGLFIPFFIFCNFKPAERASLPVLISNDYVYCAGGIVMAFTSGYFSSLTMMYAPM